MGDLTVRSQAVDACVLKLERMLQEAQDCGVSPRRIAAMLSEAVLREAVSRAAREEQCMCD